MVVCRTGSRYPVQRRLEAKQRRSLGTIEAADAARLNCNFNRTLKYVFKGAATSAIAYYNYRPLADHYQAMLKAGTKPNLAKLTIARKIAAVVLRLWKNQEDYNPSKGYGTQS